MRVRVPPSAPTPLLNAGAFLSEEAFIMDNRPIGFFDSGLGGLTSVMALKKKLPEERVIYYGDTARTPYGSKHPYTIRKFSLQIVDYLVSQNVKMIVIACNTVTAMALDMLRDRYPDIPIIGVIEPTARRVAYEGRSGVGIIGTKMTIASDVYAKKIKSFDDTIETFSLACPAIVPLVEEGIVDNEIMDLVIRHYMDRFVVDNDFDRLILGCTHYPLVSENIKRLYPKLSLISSSSEVIVEAESILRARDAFAVKSELSDRYFASDLSENFVKMIDRLLGDEGAKVELMRLDD